MCYNLTLHYPPEVEVNGPTSKQTFLDIISKTGPLSTSAMKLSALRHSYCNTDVPL